LKLKIKADFLRPKSRQQRSFWVQKERYGFSRRPRVFLFLAMLNSIPPPPVRSFLGNNSKANEAMNRKINN